MISTGRTTVFLWNTYIVLYRCMSAIAEFVEQNHEIEALEPVFRHLNTTTLAYLRYVFFLPQSRRLIHMVFLKHSSC